MQYDYWLIFSIVMSEPVSVFLCHQSTARGTVKDKVNFKVEEDVSALRKAMEGIGKLISHQYQCIRQTCKALQSYFTKCPHLFKCSVNVACFPLPYRYDRKDTN